MIRLISSAVRSTLEPSTAPPSRAPSVVPGPAVPVRGAPDFGVSDQTFSPMFCSPFGLPNDDSTICPSSFVCWFEYLPETVPSGEMASVVSWPEA